MPERRQRERAPVYLSVKLSHTYSRYTRSAGNMTTHMETHEERRPPNSRRRRRMHTRVKRHSEALAQGRDNLAGEGRERKGELDRQR